MKEHSYAIFQDWTANNNNLKGRLIMVMFRIAHLANYKVWCKILLVPHLIFYRVFVEWILGVELQFQVKIGRGLKLWHGQGLVVHKSTIIGKNCTLRQCTTIGNKKDKFGNKTSGAIIGNGVDIGSHVCIIGKITIADNCIIGAGSIVTKSFLNTCTIVGNPAKILTKT